MFEKISRDTIFAPKTQKSGRKHMRLRKIKNARRFKPGFSRGARQILLIAAAFRP